MCVGMGVGLGISEIPRCRLAHVRGEGWISSDICRNCPSFSPCAWGRLTKLDSKVLKVRDVARQLDLHANTVRRYAAEGRIKSYRFGSRGDYRFKQADVDAFMALCQTCEAAIECPFKMYFQLK